MKQVIDLPYCKRSMLVILFVFCYSVILLAQIEKRTLYLDYTQPVEKRVQDLMSRMTVAEKGAFLNHLAPAFLKVNSLIYGN